MLLRLHIRNVALIDEIEIEFGPGLNILTGETGAGKSIVIDSINMLLGERGSRDLVRSGEEKAVLEALFDDPGDGAREVLDKYGISMGEDKTLIISREYSVGGRSVCRINGTLCTVSALRELGSRLIDIHGQHDHQSLLKNENHLKMLDEFGKGIISELMDPYRELFSHQREILGRLDELTGDEIERQRLQDMLRYQIDEIEGARLKEEEDVLLSQQRKYLSNAERIKEVLEGIYESCYVPGPGSSPSMRDIIFDGAVGLGEISQFDSSFAGLGERLESIGYELEDIMGEIRNLADNTDFDPALLNKTDERLDLIFRLKRKYGRTIGEVLDFCLKGKGELSDLENSEELVQSLKGELEEIDGKMEILSEKISRARIGTAEKLREEIVGQLKELEMKDTDFLVNFEKTTSFTPSGVDKAEFLISPNRGEPLKPLSKIASGGEMARIMLAIKTILAHTDKIPTLIFDEIDMGISGRASKKVGEKLLGLTGSHQVICVTHQASIAALAHNHFLIEKVSLKEKTVTKIRDLYDNLRIDEISRLLDGGGVTDKTRALAAHMLEESVKLKNT